MKAGTVPSVMRSVVQRLAYPLLANRSGATRLNCPQRPL